jgi:transposase
MKKNRRKRYNKKLRKKLKKEDKKGRKKTDLSGTFSSAERLLLQMQVERPQLPSDLEQCHNLIEDLSCRLEEKDKLNEKLQRQLEQFLRWRYGQRSDRVSSDQLSLFKRVGPQAEEATVEEEAVESGPKPKKKKGHGRAPLPSQLPRRRVEYGLEGDSRKCPRCGSECKCIGDERSEQLEYVPATLHVIEHVRFKYACPAPDCDGSVLLAEKPSQPIEKGLPGPGLLAHVVVSKYADHLPLNRMEGILSRHGVEISRQTMCGWAKSAAEILQPLYDLMRERVLQSKVIHTDDTTIPVLAPELSKTRTGRIWVYIGDEKNPYSVFDYTPTRKRDGPEAFLSGFSGHLQADAYAGYDRIYAPGDVIEVACWAHARRKFVESESSDSLRSLTAVAWIKRLYEVEREAGEAGLGAEEIRELRREKSKALLDDFGEWLRAQQAEALPKSPIGQAISYTLSNWTALNRYVEDGDLDIDNNAAERALRGIAVGRKNWMFAGSDRGGRTAAVLVTFTQTCKSLNIDPFACLRDLLARIADHPMKNLDDLLPDQWQAKNQPPQI